MAHRPREEVVPGQHSLPGSVRQALESPGSAPKLCPFPVPPDLSFIAHEGLEPLHGERTFYCGKLQEMTFEYGLLGCREAARE